MKLSFKSITSLIAAVTMTVSSFSMITATAAYDEMGTSPIVRTASVSAQLRASGLSDGVDAEWVNMHSGSSKIVESGDLETTANKHFGVFYHFDKIDFPEDAIVTKVTIAAYQGSSKFSGKPFVMLHTENPNDKTSINDIFKVSAEAKNIVFNNTSDEEVAVIKVGETKMTELKDDDNNRTESVEITGENIEKYFNENTANSYFMYNKDRGDTGKRTYSAKAEITVEYKKAEALLTHGDTITKYEKFEDAYVSAEDGDTIKLLNDVSISKGISVKNKNITIDGNDKTINNGSNYIAFEGNKNLAVKNLNVIGTGKLEIKENATIEADYLTIQSLQINGSTITSKGILKNSTVDTLKAYGKLNLENTTVKNILFPNIKYGYGDTPKITSNSDFQAESIMIEKITSIGDGDYILFEGEYKPQNVTIATDYATLYKYEGGLIKAIPQTIPEEIPQIAIDYVAEKLTNFTNDGSYTINNTEVNIENGELAINSEWFGTTVEILKKGNGTTTTNSEAQMLAIPSIPATPSAIGVDQATVGVNDGKITGVNVTMEYKLSTESDWIAVEGTEITGLAPGQYEVRIKAVANTSFKSMSQTVTINAHGLQEPIVIPPTIADITYTDGMMLSDIILINPDGNTLGNLEWIAPETLVNAGDDQKFSAKFTPQNSNDYKTKEIEITVNIKPGVITGVTIAGYSAVYDNAEHGAVITGAMGYKVEYKIGDGEYSETAPTYKNVGTYPVTVKISKANYEDKIENVNIVISKATPDVSWSNSEITVIYTDGIKLSDVPLPEVSGTIAGTLAWEKPESVLTIGTSSYKVVFTPNDINNYNIKEGNISVKTEEYNNKKPELEGIKVTPAENLIYNGNEHILAELEGIVKDDVVSYKINNNTADELKAINAGKYSIQVTVSREGYADYEWSGNVNIAKADAEITAQTVQSAKYDGKAKNISAILNHQETMLKYSVTKNGESVSEMIEAGEYMVVISADATNNYNAPKSVTVIFTITKQDSPVVNPEIIIGEDYSSSDTSSSVDIIIKNPNEVTNSGILIASLYSEDGKCLSASFVKNGRASFKYEMNKGMIIKAFVWKAISGENAMEAVLPCAVKTVEF